MTTVSRPIAWLLVWLVAAGTFTLFPFDFSWPPNFAGWLPRELPTVREFGLNVLLFVPLGFVLRSSLHDRIPRWHLTLLAGGIGLGISLAIEGLQAFIPLRNPSISDLLANCGGACVGATGLVLVGGRTGAALRTYVAKVQDCQALGIALVCLITITLLAASAYLQFSTHLSNWNESYPLLVGNESTGDRPWSGRIFSLELTDAATPSDGVHRFSTGKAIDLSGAVIAAYIFDGSPPYRDLAGSSLDLLAVDGLGPNTMHVGLTGLKMSGEGWLRSDRTAAHITRRLRRTNAFSIRLVAATDDLNQSGPARIVSNSLNTGLRNFTVGQEGRDVVFRFRTPHNGLNGSRPEIVVPDAFHDRLPQGILITYDGSRLLAASSDANWVHRSDFSPGSSLAFTLTTLQFQQAHLGFLHIVYLVIVFACAGGLFSVVLSAAWRGPNRLWWVLWFAPLLEGTLALTSGRSPHWNNLLTNVAVGVPAFLVATSLCRRSDRADGESGSLGTRTVT